MSSRIPCKNNGLDNMTRKAATSGFDVNGRQSLAPTARASDFIQTFIQGIFQYSRILSEYDTADLKGTMCAVIGAVDDESNVIEIVIVPVYVHSGYVMG
jgi:hypothetical protein